jgi:hypothetical protein
MAISAGEHSPSKRLQRYTVLKHVTILSWLPSSVTDITITCLIVNPFSQNLRKESDRPFQLQIRTDQESIGGRAFTMTKLQVSQICDDDERSFEKGESADDSIVSNSSLLVAVPLYTVQL